MENYSDNGVIINQLIGNDPKVKLVFLSRDNVSYSLPYAPGLQYGVGLQKLCEAGSNTGIH